MQHAKAVAQAADALEQAAVTTKRRIGTDRRLLQQIRQAQAGLSEAGLLSGDANVRALGIEVETQSPGGKGHGDSQEGAGESRN